MKVIDKTVSPEITLDDLLNGLEEAPELPLVFFYEGHPTKPVNRTGFAGDRLV